MKRLYLAYTDPEIWRQAVAKSGGDDNSFGILPQAVAELAEARPQAMPKLLPTRSGKSRTNLNSLFKKQNFCDSLSQKSRGGITC
jgi:hypothetical protein